MKNQCSKLDVNHPLSKFFTRTIISSLYGSLLHPPVSYLGQYDRAKTAEPTDHIKLLQYRNADGSENVIFFWNYGIFKIDSHFHDIEYPLSRSWKSWLPLREVSPFSQSYSWVSSCTWRYVRPYVDCYFVILGSITNISSAYGGRESRTEDGKQIWNLKSTALSRHTHNSW